MTTTETTETTECPRCRESREALARVARERDEARAEVARLRDQRDRAELMDAAVAVRAARIEQEVARLRAIIDGRTVPPTDEVTP